MNRIDSFIESTIEAVDKRLGLVPRKHTPDRSPDACSLCKQQGVVLYPMVDGKSYCSMCALELFG